MCFYQLTINLVIQRSQVLGDPLRTFGKEIHVGKRVFSWIRHNPNSKGRGYSASKFLLYCYLDVDVDVDVEEIRAQTNNCLYARS